MKAKDRPSLSPVVAREGFHHGTRVYFIRLSSGHEAIVEPADWQRVAREYGTRWAATVNGSYVYARKAVQHADGSIGMVSLARVITGAQPDERAIADNGNALDLRRSNLRTKRFKGRVARARLERWQERERPEAATAQATV